MSRHSQRGPHWERFKRYMKRLVGYKCQRCGNAGRLELHHIVTLGNGGKRYDPENIEVLCRRCHFGEHRARDPQRAEWLRMIAEL